MSRNPASAWRHIHMVLVGSILSVSALGCLMIFSATRGRDPSDFDTSFLLKQGLFVAGGVVAMLVTTLVDYRRYRDLVRSEEHTSELQSLMRNSYPVFCLQ